MVVNVLGKFVKAFVGTQGLMDAADLEVSNTNLVGVLSGVTEGQSAIERLDATGIGAAIFRFTGSYSAQSSNINEWFGGRQLIRLRCTDSGFGVGVTGTVTFDLPGTTALNTAFDTLAAAGLPEIIRFVVEYTGASKDRLSIRPRVSPAPQIMGTTNIIVRSGIAAELEVTRTSGTISDYTWLSIGGVGDGGEVFDSIRLQNPSQVVWDASDGGTLPSTSAKGLAYRVVNAPSDGSGRFGEAMNNGDWVVWEGETFTAWATEPHAWFVIPAHQVRRLTALGQDFLADIGISTVSDRNTVIRGADYADSAGEIRIKIYDSVDDYSAADLNTTGQIDSFTQASDTTGVVAVRLSGTQATLASTLPDLYLYLDNTLLGNFERDLTYRGDFGAESDYILTTPINYVANETIRIYQGTTVDRYESPNLDIAESNLTEAVQIKLNNTSGSLLSRVNTLESKMTALYPLTPDVTKLNDFADIYNDSNTTQTVNITDGYSLIADYRSDSERYESTGVTYDNTGANVVTYTGLGTSYNRAFGFTISAPSDKILMWAVDGSDRIPYIDVTSAGNIRVNNYHVATTPGQDITDELHLITRTAGDTVLTTASDSVQTFTLTNFPSGSTNQSRSLDLGVEVFLNGTDTLAGHLQNLTMPATNTAQDRQTFDASIYLGPLYQNRTVNVTIGYELRVSGSDLLVDFTLISAPSDVTIDIQDTYTSLSYTSQNTTTRTDNYLNLTDELGDYTFTGAVDLLLTFHPIANTSIMEVVPVVINASDAVDELNDRNVPIPPHDFSSVEIPDDIDFTTFQADHFFIHRDLASLIRRRGTKWAYGLALLEEITEQQITEQVDFTQGIVLTDTTTGDRYLISVDNGSLKHEIIT